MSGNDRFLTGQQKELIAMKKKILSSIDRSRPLAPQFREISERFIREGIPIAPLTVKKYYYSYRDIE